MSTPSDPQWPQPGKDATSDELEVDIKHTREQLGETIDALSQKFDLKAQARHTLQDANRRAVTRFQTARGRAELVLAQAKDAATDAHGTLKPVVTVGAAVAVGTIAAVVVLVVWSRRR